MYAFLVDGNVLTHKGMILNLWEDHFEALDYETPSVTGPLE